MYNNEYQKTVLGRKRPRPTRMMKLLMTQTLWTISNSFVHVTIPLNRLQQMENRTHRKNAEATRRFAQSDEIAQFMQIAKEERARAVQATEDKYKREIAELKSQIEDMQTDSILFTSSVPDTSKALADAQKRRARAVQEMEKRYQSEIQMLRAKLAEYERSSPSAPTRHASSGSSVPPWDESLYQTELAEKVRAYHKLLSDYVVKAQRDKAFAVEMAEARLTAKYERIIAELKGEGMESDGI
jgi:gas vesicle protein